MNKIKRVAYIAGPYRAKSPREILENIRRAERVAIKYWQMGYVVICPHLNSRLFDGILPDEVFLDGSLELLRRSDVIVMVDGWEDSAGAKEEYRKARGWNKEIVFDGAGRC